MPTERYQGDCDTTQSVATNQDSYFLRWTAILDKEGRQKESDVLYFITETEQEREDMKFAINAISDQILETGGAAICLTYTNREHERRTFACNNIVALFTNFDISTPKEEFE